MGKYFTFPANDSLLDENLPRITEKISGIVNKTAVDISMASIVSPFRNEKELSWFTRGHLSYHMGRNVVPKGSRSGA